MKEDMGIANEMALLVLGLRKHSALNCARSAPELIYIGTYNTYLQFMVARSDRLQ